MTKGDVHFLSTSPFTPLSREKGPFEKTIWGRTFFGSILNGQGDGSIILR